MLLPEDRSRATTPLLSDSRCSSLTPLPGMSQSLGSHFSGEGLAAPECWREPALTREVCGEAQGQEAETRGALHLFERVWKQLRALLSAQEPGLAQGILPAPRKCGSNQPWQCLSEQSHSTRRQLLARAQLYSSEASSCTAWPPCCLCFGLNC